MFFLNISFFVIFVKRLHLKSGQNHKNYLNDQVSDDTVLLLSTAEGLVTKSQQDTDTEKLYSEIAHRYRNDFFRDMGGRAGGMTTGASCSQLRPLQPGGWKIPFNNRGGGCGAAMRAMCIGLRYPDYTDEGEHLRGLNRHEIQEIPDFRTFSAEIFLIFFAFSGKFYILHIHFFRVFAFSGNLYILQSHFWL